MRPLFPLLACLLITLGALAGCLGQIDEDDHEPVDSEDDLTDVKERFKLPFDTTQDWSFTLEEGLYDRLPVESVFVDVDLPVELGGAALTGDARVHMGIFRPDVPEGTKVPVIADFGPYYGTSDTPATEPAGRLGEFLIENFVQHGYAVAQVSVFGSGQSNHCMDLMGESEQLGVDAAVSALGEADWSNGKVGLIGRSYDGSTPWQAAMFGNPHLSTIVPISGLIGMHELMWKNGTAETRGPIMHNYVYGRFGVDSDPANGHIDEEDWQNLCRDYVLGLPEGAAAFATGDHAAPEVNHYWRERYFLDRVLENYEGSVYLIQGLQDWNVDPHMAFPTHHLLEDAGIEVKGLYGQWAHMYPDRPSEHERLPSGRGGEAFPATVRWDWAQDLLEWFDHYLKGTGSKPPLHSEVQDHMGQWRLEESYPPRELDWEVLRFGADERVSGDGVVAQGREPTVFEFGPFEETVRITGMPRLHLSVTPTGPGGQVFAYLQDKTEGLRLGHAVMDLRYHEGGNKRVEVAPGVPIIAKMEFFAMDVIVPAGHEIELRLSNTGMDYLPSAVPAPVIVDAVGPLASSGMSELKLPLREVPEERFFTPPEGEIETTE